MSSTQLSPWERVQLVLLRLLSTALGVIDDLFGVSWGKRLLEHMARRWQAQLSQLDTDLARLEDERRRLQLQSEALALQAAAIYLCGRKLTTDRLLFDPADPHDEEILDASIDLLVKEQLAGIEPQEIETGRYVYSLEPDWPAIRARLEQAVAQATGETAEWLGEGIQLIDETLLSLAGEDGRPIHPTVQQE